MSNPIAAVSTAIGKLFGFLTASKERQKETYELSEIKRMQNAIEYGEKMALRVKELGVDDKELNKYIMVFFKYNQ